MQNTQHFTLVSWKGCFRSPANTTKSPYLDFPSYGSDLNPMPEPHAAVMTQAGGWMKVYVPV